MVLFVDLEDEAAEPPDVSRMEISSRSWSNAGHGDWRDFHAGDDHSTSNSHGDWREMLQTSQDSGPRNRPNPNVNAVTEAMGCFPIITSLASHLDLNTLDSLSQTCRQVRANLLQYRSHLLASTLHCENEDLEINGDHVFRYRARAADWYFVEQGRESRDVGKVGDCARDMVAGVYLCQPCGRSLRSSDSEYEGIWKWRTRYLPSLGGLGVGIGEGDRGVPCGRGASCVAAREVESEIDCDAEDAREVYSPSPPSSSGSTPVSSPPRGGFGGAGMGPGYSRHEIEGIGGRLKKKLVLMVKVGACVPEFGEEKEAGRFLTHEKLGKARSWCGWCWRIVPGERDMTEVLEKAK
ncbi:hypothetical protein BP6252_12352 [Coleophoma cylindrospora]|uniref:Uncharacterized protein n=1 Tax=Coleophoma cylindrospora TaxID=1849047 RepID=A0A3D8QGR0_9HELO|nr:hypothetical protein BP6252_12352 [Coleophoma cylindrospora]